MKELKSSDFVEYDHYFKVDDFLLIDEIIAREVVKKREERINLLLGEE